MSEGKAWEFERLATGVPGLDEVLGGGIPEYSFNLIAGEPGSGKTTLIHQFIYANASPERTVLYFTALGEPPLKMLRYQQQMAFFDPAKVGTLIRFVDLSPEVRTLDLDAVLARIVQEVEASNPAIVVVDSFRSIVRGTHKDTETEMQGFVQRLALHLTSWQVTSFLIGEYTEQEAKSSPVFTVADGILWLFQSRDGNAVLRKLQVMKLRGQSTLPGLHTFRISTQGVHVFPRLARIEARSSRSLPPRRVATGVPGMDELMRGGMLDGDFTLVSGPSGTGKTVLATHFIGKGVELDEPGVLVLFEEHPEDYLFRARQMGYDVEAMVQAGKLHIIYLRTMDLLVDETLHHIRQAVKRVGARRLVIDSLSGFEVALAPPFREEFRESLYQLVGALTRCGVTVLMTLESVEHYHQLAFSVQSVSFLADNIIMLRYLEAEGELRKVLTVVKMRRSAHSRELRSYTLSSRGMRIGKPLREYRGILSGVPERQQDSLWSAYPGLTEPEGRVLRVLREWRESTEDALSEVSGLAPAELTEALKRLVALDYALVVKREGETFYRALVRESGPESP
jgi:circadian clock protein KaiC